MNILFSILSLSLFNFQGVMSPQDDGIDTSADEAKVQEAVIAWADATFYSHSEYKFEKFHAFWTEDYEIHMMRIDAYNEMLSDLEKDKAAGKYKGTDDDYSKEHSELKEKLETIKNENIAKRADYFQINFWTNIQTSDGITVYYEHIIKLDNDYNVFEFIENSSIGKKSDKTLILYKDGRGGSTTVKKKLNNPNLQRIDPNPSGNVDGNNGNGNNGSVGITFKTDESVDQPVDEVDDKKSKKKKKKKKEKKKKVKK